MKFSEIKTNHKSTDLTGNKYGTLTVIDVYGKNCKNSLLWNCLCECGNFCQKTRSSLLRGINPNCGCLGKKFMNIKNHKYNKLTVINYVGRNTNKNHTWKCLCDCGNYIICEASDVKQGKVKSCGCLRIEKSLLPKVDNSAFNKLYSQYKQSAKSRTIVEFKLTKNDFKKITKSNCYYCGIKPNQLIVTNRNKSKEIIKTYLHNGIDRIDNEKGYTIDNCVPCCTICNKAKNNFSKEFFLEWIDRIANFQGYKK